MNHTKTQNNPKEKQKQTPEQKQAQRRAENGERIACLRHALENVPPGMEGTNWQADRQRELDAALEWAKRNPAPAGQRPAAVKLAAAAVNGMEGMIEPMPPEIAKVKRTRAMRLPVKAPPGKVSVNLLNPDGSLWERVHLDAAIWGAMNRYAESRGITVDEAAEQALLHALERDTRTVTLEFSPEAFALIEANRTADGYASAEDFIRASLCGTVGAFCESLDSQTEALKEAFAAPVPANTKEGGAL